MKFSILIPEDTIGHKLHLFSLLLICRAMGTPVSLSSAVNFLTLPALQSLINIKPIAGVKTICCMSLSKNTKKRKQWDPESIIEAVNAVKEREKKNGLCRWFKDTGYVPLISVPCRPHVSTPQQDRYLTVTVRRNRNRSARISSELAYSCLRTSGRLVQKTLYDLRCNVAVPTMCGHATDDRPCGLSMKDLRGARELRSAKLDRREILYSNDKTYFHFGWKSMRNSGAKDILQNVCKMKAYTKWWWYLEIIAFIKVYNELSEIEIPTTFSSHCDHRKHSIVIDKHRYNLSLNSARDISQREPIPEEIVGSNSFTFKARIDCKVLISLIS
ncbi:hypothetical protein C0J52_26345 [Blattella germanica]|nr:hypothetical protein C0J52_26345 [Blattella germanica]